MAPERWIPAYAGMTGGVGITGVVGMTGGNGGLLLTLNLYLIQEGF